MSGVTKFRDSWRCRDLLTNGVVLIAVFLIHRSIKCHLTDFRGDLQFDLLISNDYVCTKLNGLAFFLWRVKFSPYITAASEFK